MYTFFLKTGFTLRDKITNLASSALLLPWPKSHHASFSWLQLLLFSWLFEAHAFFSPLLFQLLS